MIQSFLNAVISSTTRFGYRVPGVLAVIVMAAIVAVAVLAFTALLPAQAHSWYEGLTSPEGGSCCGEDDCGPVLDRWNLERGGIDLFIDGAWTPLDWSRVIDEPSKDGRYHACIWPYDPPGHIRCIIAPVLGS